MELNESSLEMNTDLYEISTDGYNRRAQIPLRKARFDYLVNDYISKKNDEYCMVHKPNHFLIYNQHSGFCQFDASYIVFDKLDKGKIKFRIYK